MVLGKPYFSGLNEVAIGVSILVLMDGAREAARLRHFLQNRRGFNPCFDGWCSGRYTDDHSQNTEASFNPCFDGWCSGRKKRILDGPDGGVSILVLMDGAREDPTANAKFPPLPVSILVLMDGAREESWLAGWGNYAAMFQSLF